MSIGTRICWLVVCTSFLTMVVLTWVGYATASRQYIAGVDRQLTAAAAALPGVIGADYLRRALANEDLPSSEFDDLVHLLDDLADRSGVFYLYVFSQDGDRVVHLATSASPAERAAGDWSAFLETYREPPPELLSTFADGRTRFAEYTDEFGSFRSIFVRHTGPGGQSYVAGVDATLNSIRSDLASLVWRQFGAGTIVAILTGTVGVLLARRLVRPLKAVSEEVHAWSRRDFARDDSIHAHLDDLAGKHRDEVGDLAARFVEMQGRLERYLRELTETTAAKQKIEEQMEVARNIQAGLLPSETPQIENFHVIGWSQPADQTGGDYFDWVELADGRVLLTLGDVTGHGIGPALLAAASRAYARATLDVSDALDDSIARLNKLLHTDLPTGRFVTLVAGLLDPASRSMKLVAAGHGPSIFYSRRRDEIDAAIDTQGLPLGVTDQMGYERPVDLKFEPGDVLVLVSDGFFEWANAKGEIFGVERLGRSILASCREAPDEIVDRLRRDLTAFHGGTPEDDDTTAVVIRCVG